MYSYIYAYMYSILAYREDVVVAAASPPPSLDPTYEVTDSTDTTCEKKDEYATYDYDHQLHTGTATDNNASSYGHTAPQDSNSNSNSSSVYIMPVSTTEPETDSSEWGLGPDRSGVLH